MKKMFTYLILFFFAATMFVAPAFAAAVSEPVSGGSSGPGQPDKATVNAAAASSTA